MTIVTTSEAQAMLPRLLASVAQGEEVLITDGGLPVARLIQPTAQRPTALAPPTQARTPETDLDEDEDRPWRGVFAIESPGEPYPGGKLHLPPEPLLPEQQPADILWDRRNSTDE
jgi:antitoxin (DNA-binding transcriptional repressor) of toxin-antitoxin stability system